MPSSRASRWSSGPRFVRVVRTHGAATWGLASSGRASKLNAWAEAVRVGAGRISPLRGQRRSLRCVLSRRWPIGPHLCARSSWPLRRAGPIARCPDAVLLGRSGSAADADATAHAGDAGGAMVGLHAAPASADADGERILPGGGCAAGRTGRLVRADVPGRRLLRQQRLLPVKPAHSTRRRIEARPAALRVRGLVSRRAMGLSTAEREPPRRRTRAATGSGGCVRRHAAPVGRGLAPGRCARRNGGLATVFQRS